MAQSFESSGKQCARLVCSKKRYESVKDDISSDLKWLRPEAVHKRSVLLHMYKIINSDEAPQIWKDNFRPNNEIHSYNTRQCRNLHHPYKPRTRAGEKTFMFSGYTAWNKLDDQLKSLSYHNFKLTMTNMLLSESE